MKTKKLNKKLFLNKKTIAALNGNEMRFVDGGVGEGGIRCDSFKSTMCPTLTCTYHPDTRCGTICLSNPCC